MSPQKNNLSREGLRIKDELREYFVESSIECPYDMIKKAVYNQALFDTMPDFLMETYLASGYRRNGNIIYNMHCQDCRECIPLRLDPQIFCPNRNQKRTRRENLDIEVEIEPLTCSDENVALLDRFLEARYPGRDSSGMDYYNGFFLNHITNTVEFRYRVGSRLLGVAVVDLSFSWLNVVFFFFDPAESRRSPGTFNILNLIEFSRNRGIRSVYLGYWIKEARQMSYKANFKPHFILQDKLWQRVER